MSFTNVTRVAITTHCIIGSGKVLIFAIVFVSIKCQITRESQQPKVC